MTITTLQETLDLVEFTESDSDFPPLQLCASTPSGDDKYHHWNMNMPDLSYPSIGDPLSSMMMSTRTQLAWQ